MRLFIAELGINHGGDMHVAKKMIRQAADSGASIAKFQMYDPIKILGPESLYLAEASKAQFTKDQHRELKGYCDVIGIEYCCSVFHPRDVPFFEEIGMKRYKIASRSTLDIPLIRAINATGKPIIVSNGLDKALHEIREEIEPRSKLSILRCIAKYPTSVTELMNDLFDYENGLGLAIKIPSKWGLSSHCSSIVPSLTCIAAGASIIEHHVRFDWQKEGCDMNSSITFQQFKEMVDIARRELC